MKTEYVAVVSAADALEGGLPWSETLVYVFAQIFGTSVERCWPISCFRFHSCHCPGTCGADPHNSSASSPQRSVVYVWFGGPLVQNLTWSHLLWAAILRRHIGSPRLHRSQIQLWPSRELWVTHSRASGPLTFLYLWPPNSPGALGRRYSSDGWFQACLRPPKTCSSGITTTS